LLEIARDAIFQSAHDPLLRSIVGGERVREKAAPHYDLETVRRAFREGDYMLPVRVRRHMRSLRWGPVTLVSCVAMLEPRDFHKSQQHRTRSESWLDIYRPFHSGERLYLKFTEHEDGQRLLVLAFCIDGTAH
jgi:hypothetical protein